MPRKRPPSSPAYTSSASPSPRPDRLAPPVPTTSSTIFSGVEPGPPATDTAPDRHTRMPKSAAKRRQPRRLPPLTSPMKHRGEGVHQVEDVQRTDGVDQRDDHVQRDEQRQGDVAELAPRAGAVDHRRLTHIVRNGLQRRQDRKSTR